MVSDVTDGRVYHGRIWSILIGLIFDISGHFQAAIVAMLAIVMLMIGVQLSMKLGKNVMRYPIKDQYTAAFIS